MAKDGYVNIYMNILYDSDNKGGIQTGYYMLFYQGSWKTIPQNNLNKTSVHSLFWNLKENLQNCKLLISERI